MTERHPGRMNFIPGWRLVFTALCILLAGCGKHPPTIPVIINSEVSPQPVRVGSVTVTFRISDSASKPVSNARIQLEGNMTHPGMSPVLGEAEEIEAGRYEGVL